MKPTNEKPVNAQTAGAMDTFNVSESHNVQQANKDSGGHYIGDNNEKLFTSDEVNTLIRERLDRYLKSLLSKYELSSKEELDSLVSLAKKMNEVYKSYNSSHQTNIEEGKTLIMEQQTKPLNKDIGILDVINILKDREYCSIGFIQKSLNIGFSKAGNYFNTLVDANIVNRKGDAKGCKVNQKVLNEYLHLSEEEIKEKLLKQSILISLEKEKQFENRKRIRDKVHELTTFREFIRLTSDDPNTEIRFKIEKCLILCHHLLSDLDEKSDDEYLTLEKDFQDIKKKMSDLVSK